MNKINIGIVAHVDAGKTTVTEQLLYHSGVIKEAGRVDMGNTQTDSMELERKRGISIKAAATSFSWKGMKINLIDTPGHVDFISEVERSLGVLDGAVLVVSAKEGIQAQTRILFDTLRNLNIPTLIFINKLDRLGSDYNKVIRDFKTSLSEKVVPLQHVLKEGCKDIALGPLYSESLINDHIINVLCELDEAVLYKYVNNEKIYKQYIKEKISFYAKQGSLYPVLCGSALNGLGIGNLLDGIIEYLPWAAEEENSELSGVVFKIEREKAYDKRAYVRLFQGHMSVRDMIDVSSKETQEKIKKLEAIKDGKRIEENVIAAGDIGIIYGIESLKIGDVIGAPCSRLKHVNIAKPILKSKISPVQNADKAALFKTLSMMAEEDPLLQLELDDMENEIYINLFGYVQLEIITAVLEENHGLKIIFSDTSTLYKETPAGRGDSFMKMWQGMNPYAASVGLRVEPSGRGEGLTYASEVSLGSLSKTFQNAVEEAVRQTMRHGLLGWEVTDAKVTFTASEYNSVDSTPSDFRDVTPMVLMEALEKAKTELLEPYYEFELRVPQNAGSRALADLQKMRAVIRESVIIGSDFAVRGVVPVDASKYYALQVAAYTEGSGRFFTKFYGYEKATCDPQQHWQRKRIDPLNKKQYLAHKLNVIRNGYGTNN